jgi:hypothetical protein
LWVVFALLDPVPDRQHWLKDLRKCGKYYINYLEDERVEVRVSRLHLCVLGHGSPALSVQQTHVVLENKCRLFTIQRERALSTAIETSVADPHPACHFDAEPDPDTNFQIKAQNLE